MGMVTGITEIVAVYCRVSSEDQAERGTIDVQKVFAKNYIDLYKLQLYDYYCDEGISGTVPVKDRPEGSRLMQDAQMGLFNTVLFYKLDRLGRKTTVILEAIQNFTKYGINVRSMTEPLDTNTPAGKFLITTLSGIAELDRDSILARMHSGALVAAKKGKWLGGIVPFGYLTDKEGRLIVNREKIPGLEYSEEDIVKIIFNLCGNENKSCRDIADYINALGVPTRYIPTKNLVRQKHPGKRLQNNAPLWGPSRVLRMIHSTLYMGQRTFGLRATLKDYDPIEQQVPPIVDEETWNRANRAVSARTITYLKQRKASHLLQGYLVCGNCGHSYCGCVNKKHPEKTSSYSCNGKRAYNPAWRCTTSVSIPADWIEQSVLDHCATLLREGIFQDTPHNVKNRQSEYKALEIDTIHKALNKLKQEKDAILTLYRKQLINIEDLTKQLEKIKQEKSTLQSHLQELIQPSEEEIIAKNKLSSAEFVKKFQRFFTKDYNLHSLSFETQRDILFLLIDRILIYTEKATSDSYYSSLRVVLKDKLGNTKEFTLEGPVKMQTQQHKISTSISNLGEKLRSLRLKQGYTQQYVADCIGLTVTTVNAYENQRKTLSNPVSQHDTIRKLADFYGLKYEQLSIWNYNGIATDDKKLFDQIRDVKGVTSEEVFTEMGVTKPTFRKYLLGIFSTRTKNKIDSYFAAEKKWLKKLLQSR